MAVTLYRWDDASAPVLNGTAGSMIAVLDACLVNGYGSKPAAGWTKPFSGTNLAAYRAGGGTQAYLDVVDTSTTAALLRGYMAMTGLSAGTDPFPTAAQIAGGNAYYKSTAGSTSRPWVVIADNKRFYMISASAQTSAEGLQASSNSTSVHGLFFGDIVSYVPSDAFCAAIVSTNSNGQTASQFGTVDMGGDTGLAGHYIVRDYTQTGSSLLMAKGAAGRANSPGMGAAGGAFPSPVHGGIDLEPVFLCEPTTRVTRGHFPGLWNPIHQRPGTPMDTFTGKTSTPLAGKTFLILPTTSGGTQLGHCCIEISDTWE